MAKTKKPTVNELVRKNLLQKQQLIRLKAENKARATLINEGWQPPMK